MTKSELIDALSQEAGSTKKQAGEFLDALEKVVGKELSSGGELTLPGIGKLSVAQKPERKGRNPATGESITIAARKAVQFKALKVLKDRIQ